MEKDEFRVFRQMKGLKEKLMPNKRLKNLKKYHVLKVDENISRNEINNVFKKN